MSEARKFRLSLIVAHQYLAQINDETADAVWGSVGSIVAFQVGSDDAEMVAQQLGKYPRQITPENLSGLPKYAAYARLLADHQALVAVGGNLASDVIRKNVGRGLPGDQE